ncbi:hypothetical protein DXD17_02755 [[Ruminococcus] lactaris]|jgi:tRNA G10  N-methylase Trm11|uniref:Uncharacterized protein n=1 Tax=[Ruminococcus] lactaris TaxID=46228 RepID=A0A3E4LWX4_9FIRM|nr:hypothetical protein [[Ruminococcus] lactaris]RGK41968.1 hypothetical protein DXD17_02755 [[Ruminococcus] lactaris]
MKYDVTFSCGHTETVEIYGKTEDREKKIAYYGKSGICRKCYEKMMNEKNSENCEEVRMSYREYKENYADRKTKSGSYDKEEKTIVVYVPKKEEKEDSRQVFGKALNAAVKELKKENESAGPEDVMPVMVARELDKMGYTEEKLKKMKDVPETVLKDVLERKENWTK